MHTLSQRCSDAQWSGELSELDPNDSAVSSKRSTGWALYMHANGTEGASVLWTSPI